MKPEVVLRIAACVVVAVAARPATAAILSGPVVNPANGNAYYLLEAVPSTGGPNPFDASQAEAQSLGGNLATINDAAEDAWVYDTFDAIAVAASPASNRKALLLGLTDQAVEGTYEWINGEPFGYTNWALGQPQANDPDEDFVGIALSNNAFIQSSRWHDIVFDAGDVVYGVVEVVIPEPTSALLLASFGLIVLTGRRSVRNAA